MNNNNIKILVEFLSASLILSYFFIHNIIIVLIGTFFSFYLVNLKFFNSYIRALNQGLANIKLDNKKEKDLIHDSIQDEFTKEYSSLSLVEEIEELGFIPSINKNENSNVA